MNPLEEMNRFWTLLMPRGLCPDKTDHEPHVYASGSLGIFLCAGDQSEREPYRSERRRRELVESTPETEEATPEPQPSETA